MVELRMGRVNHVVGFWILAVGRSGLVAFRRITIVLLEALNAAVLRGRRRCRVGMFLFPLLRFHFLKTMRISMHVYISRIFKKLCSAVFFVLMPADGFTNLRLNLIETNELKSFLEVESVGQAERVVAQKALDSRAA